MGAQRIDLSNDEARRIVKYLRAAVIPRMSRSQMISMILTISLENARLAAEVNTHRATLGIKLMPIYKPGKMDDEQVDVDR